MSASPTAETRVLTEDRPVETRIGFVVEYRELPGMTWKLDEVCSFQSRAEIDAKLLLWHLRDEFPKVEVRIVRETSVITREVLP